MTRSAPFILGTALLALTACWTEGDDKAAAEVEATFDNTADQLEAAADNASGAAEERLEDEAEVFRETGEAAADAVDDTDLSASAGNAAE